MVRGFGGYMFGTSFLAGGSIAEPARKAPVESDPTRELVNFTPVFGVNYGTATAVYFFSFFLGADKYGQVGL